MSQSEQKEATFVPPSQVDPAELSKLFQEEGIIEKAVEPEEGALEQTKEAPVKAEAPKEVQKEEPKKEEPPALLKIAREREAFRKEVEQIKPFMDAFRGMSLDTVSALVKAANSRDPVAVLSALNISHSEYNKKLLADTESEPEKKSGNSELDAMRQEIQALRQERENERTQQARTQVMGKMREVVKEDKYPFIAARQAYDNIENLLIDFHKKNGVLPGESFEESVQLAAEEVERHLRKEAESYEAVLTKVKGVSLSTPRAPETQPVAGTVQSRTLTNSNTTAPAAARTPPKTRQEVLDAILSDRFEDLET